MDWLYKFCYRDKYMTGWVVFMSLFPILLVGGTFLMVSTHAKDISSNSATSINADGSYRTTASSSSQYNETTSSIKTWWHNVIQEAKDLIKYLIYAAIAIWLIGAVLSALTDMKIVGWLLVAGGIGIALWKNWIIGLIMLAVGLACHGILELIKNSKRQTEILEEMAKGQQSQQ